MGLVIAALALAACEEAAIADPPVEQPKPVPVAKPRTPRWLIRISNLYTDPRCPYPVHRPPMERMSAVGPICITASNAVPVATLERAGRWVATMLQHRPDLVEAMQAEGVTGYIRGRHENSCDLTILDIFDNRDSICQPDGQGTPTDRWADAGSGNAFASHTAFLCPEERLITPSGRNVCVHEAAHTIAKYVEIDPLRDRWALPEVQHLWRPTLPYDFGHFFTAITEIYFCVGNGDYPRTAEDLAYAPKWGLNCAHELRAYDPETYALLDAIYRGSADLRGDAP